MSDNKNNSGHCNSGNRNSGDYNSGDYNSGNYNNGNHNSGDYNNGDYNSGNFNSGDGYRNYFCTKTRYFLFDTEVSENTNQKVDLIFREMYSWFNLEDKTYKEAWKSCPKETLSQLAKLPEFQTKSARKKFKEITGLALPKIK